MVFHEFGRGLHRPLGGISVLAVCVFFSVCCACFAFQNQPDPAGNKVVEWIRSVEAEGDPPNDADFVKKCIELKATRSEMVAGWSKLRTLQKPIISKKELIDLISLKRAAIHDMDCRYSHEEYPLTGEVPSGSMSAVHYENRLVSSGAKIELHERRSDKKQKKPSEAITAYDGEFVRYVDLSGHTPQGSIQKFSGRGAFFRPFDPFAQSMLLNGAVDMHLPVRSLDLVELLGAEATIIFQKVDEVDNRKCLIAADGLFRAYLDIDRDFSVCRLDLGGWNSEGVGDRAILTRYDVNQIRRFEEFSDFGNGLWLPKQTVETIYNRGKPESRRTTRIEELIINKDVDPKVFEDIFPKGTFVCDGIRSATYTYGAGASIEGTLKDTIDQQHGWRTWLVVLNICAILILLWMIWRKRNTVGSSS